MTDSCQLQTNTFIFLLWKYIPDLGKTFIAFCFDAKTIMVCPEFIFSWIKSCFTTGFVILQYFNTQLHQQPFFICIFIAVYQAELVAGRQVSKSILIKIKVFIIEEIIMQQ